MLHWKIEGAMGNWSRSPVNTFWFLYTQRDQKITASSCICHTRTCDTNQGWLGLEICDRGSVGRNWRSSAHKVGRIWLKSRFVGTHRCNPTIIHYSIQEQTTTCTSDIPQRSSLTTLQDIQIQRCWCDAKWRRRTICHW